MNFCINPKSEQVIALANELGLSANVTAAKVGHWMKTNNTDNFLDYLKDLRKNKNSILYQNVSTQGIITSEKVIRDLAARISDRIGINFRFISDRTLDWKGQLLGNEAVINLANATLDTPIHEILGHPIIRAIKIGNNNFIEESFDNSNLIEELNIIAKEENWTKEKYNNEYNNLKVKNESYSTLYKNLLSELKTSSGKEVLDRIKLTYTNKPPQNTHNIPYVNRYGIELESFIESAINTGHNLKQIVDMVLNTYEAIDGEWMHFNMGEYTPEFAGDEGPIRSTDIFAVYNELGIFEGQDYSLDELEEEAIVELLGLMTAEKLDNVKDGKLISLLKRILKEIKEFIRSLLNQKEVEIDKLPENMTIDDLANLLAYSNSKLILPGYEVEYSTPDNSKFKNYQEASNHITNLFKNSKNIDLNNIKISYNQEIINKLKEQVKNFKFDIRKLDNEADFYTKAGRLRQNYWARKNDGSTGYLGGSDETLIGNDYDGFVLLDELDYRKKTTYIPISKEKAELLYNELSDKDKATVASSQEWYRLQRKIVELENDGIEGFIKKNKEFEQSKEIIEKWKSLNNIIYNPEEVYSRNQEFSSVVGAYSSFDVNLLMQNLLSHIEDNEKAGGKFAISAYTKPMYKAINHLEGGGGKIKFKIYPKSENILWASNTDVYSGSVWDASKKVNKDKSSELLGVSYTKYPSLYNINTVQPNLTYIIEDLKHHHNELGIVLTGNNFRLEYDEDIPYQTKKIIDGINKTLDLKYGKIIKPDLSKYIFPNKDTGYEIIHSKFKMGGVEYKVQGYDMAMNDNDIIIIENLKTKDKLKVEFVNIKDLIIKDPIKPTKTFDNLKHSINSIADTDAYIDVDSKIFEIANDIDAEEVLISKTKDSIMNYKERIEKTKTKISILSVNDIHKYDIYHAYKNNGISIDEHSFTHAAEFDLITKIYKPGRYGMNSTLVSDEFINKALQIHKDNLLNENERNVEAVVNLTDELEKRNKEIQDMKKIMLGLSEITPIEYNAQLLINIKISALKEISKKYPRSLIRSEIKKIYVPGEYSSDLFEDLPFQKVPVILKAGKKNTIEVEEKDRCN